MEYATREELDLLRQGRRDVKWMGEHRSELLEQFDGQFIAVKNEKVVAANPSHDELLNQLKRLGFNPALMLVEYLTSKACIL